MSYDMQDFENIVQDLVRSIQLLLSGTSGQFQLDQKERTHEASLKIKSQLPNRAPIEIVVEEDFGAYLTVGKGSVFEIRLNSVEPGGQTGFSQKVLATIEAVIKNGFEEKVLVSRGIILGASGLIRASGPLKADLKESWRKIPWNIFAKKTWEHHVYLPY